MKAPLTATCIWLVITLIIYTLLYKWLDIPTMYLIYNAYENSAWWHRSEIITYVFAPELWGGLGLIAFIYGYQQLKKPHGIWVAYIFTLGSSLTLAAIIVTLLKFILARYRPIELTDFNLYGFHFFSFKHNLNSTPSGHAGMSFALFFTLGRFVRKWWFTWLILIPPLLISCSRLILADHYLSDLILGAYVGIFSVLWAEWLLQHFLSFITPRIGSYSHEPDLFA